MATKIPNIKQTNQVFFRGSSGGFTVFFFGGGSFVTHNLGKMIPMFFFSNGLGKTANYSGVLPYFSHLGGSTTKYQDLFEVFVLLCTMGNHHEKNTIWENMFI